VRAQRLVADDRDDAVASHLQNTRLFDAVQLEKADAEIQKATAGALPTLASVPVTPASKFPMVFGGIIQVGTTTRWTSDKT
jgi:hypothetical protein